MFSVLKLPSTMGAFAAPDKTRIVPAALVRLAGIAAHKLPAAFVVHKVWFAPVHFLFQRREESATPFLLLKRPLPNVAKLAGIIS